MAGVIAFLVAAGKLAFAYKSVLLPILTGVLGWLTPSPRQKKASDPVPAEAAKPAGV